MDIVSWSWFWTYSTFLFRSVSDPPKIGAKEVPSTCWFFGVLPDLLPKVLPNPSKWPPFCLARRSFSSKHCSNQTPPKKKNTRPRSVVFFMPFFTHEGVRGVKSQSHTVVRLHRRRLDANALTKPMGAQWPMWTAHFGVSTVVLKMTCLVLTWFCGEMT